VFAPLSRGTSLDRVDNGDLQYVTASVADALDPEEFAHRAL